jgi:hypothetical protein
MQLYKHVIDEIKDAIDKDDLKKVKEMYDSIDFTDSQVPWDYVFQKVYLYACLKKKQIFISWFENIFHQFNPIQQSGIRHTLNYGRFISR